MMNKIVTKHDEETYYLTVPKSSGRDTAIINGASNEVAEITDNPFLAALIGNSLKEVRKGYLEKVEKEIVIDTVPWKYKVVPDRKGGQVVVFKRLTDPEEIGERQLAEAVADQAPFFIHDANNFLAAIDGRCSLLLESQKNLRQSEKQVIEDLINTSKGLQGLCQTYMRWSKKPNKNLELVDLNTSIDGVVNYMVRLYKNKDIRIITDYNYSLPKVKASYDLLDRLWYNLLSNACESTENTGRPGRVVLSTNSKPVNKSELVEVSIIDNGCGMDKETLGAWKSQEKIEPFSTKEKGHGWGRLVVLDMIRQNKSAGYSIESKEGVGTKFSVYFEKAQ